RTEWQCYVDRLRNSQHTATDEFENRVWEAEHLFLGVEPTLKFPVLIHQRILSEHCYIAGQTGSGKTSLGIMPILIQLIRGYNVADREKYQAAAVGLLNEFVSYTGAIFAFARDFERDGRIAALKGRARQLTKWLTQKTIAGGPAKEAHRIL